MTVSIIIAVKDCCANLKECVGKCLELEFKDYEILILPDLDFAREAIFASSSIKIIPTGKIPPPYKRDLGAKEAKGEILAFLDDDAYPSKDWLSEVLKIFREDDRIGCVCGPAVTPQSDSLRQKASGLVYASAFISANHSFRYLPKNRREVLDFPSCNFLIKKTLFQQVGGFDKPYWPGEDTFLCLKVLTTGKKMIYDPKVLVFHHRRPLFKDHLRQIENYALHRGYFAKKYPETSRRLEYFIPSIFILAVVTGGLVSLFFPAVKRVYLLGLAIYLPLMAISSFVLIFKEKEDTKNKILLLPLVFLGIIFTHLTYGFYFIKGLLAKKMPEE